MQAILDTQYSSVFFDVEKSLLINKWKATTTHMKAPNFKQELFHFFNSIQSQNPQLILLDSQDFAYSIPPELQDWISSIIKESCESHKIKKQAIIKTEHFFAQVSLEQLIEENSNYSFENQFFQEKQEAIEWLLDI